MEQFLYELIEGGVLLRWRRDYSLIAECFLRLRCLGLDISIEDILKSELFTRLLIGGGG
jgi:hypothetical protein